MTIPLNYNISTIKALNEVFYPGAIIPVGCVFKNPTNKKTIKKNNNIVGILDFVDFEETIDNSHIGIVCQQVAAKKMAAIGITSNYDKGADFEIIGNPLELKTKIVGSQTAHTICNGNLFEMLVPTWDNSSFKEKMGYQFRIGYIINDATSIKIVDPRLFNFTPYHDTIRDSYDKMSRDVIGDHIRGDLSNVTKVKTYSDKLLQLEVSKPNSNSNYLNFKWRVTNSYMNTLTNNVLSAKFVQAAFS